MSMRLEALFLAMALLVPSYTGSQSPEAPRPAPGSAPAKIAFKTEPGMTEQLVRAGAVLVLLAVGLLSSAYGYRYLRQQRLAGSGRRLKVVETLPLASKTRLFLVELDHHVILLGQHGATLSVLADHAQSEEGSDRRERAETR
jgi:flagellar biogenesis protein FliO